MIEGKKKEARHWEKATRATHQTASQAHTPPHAWQYRNEGRKEQASRRKKDAQKRVLGRPFIPFFSLLTIRAARGSLYFGYCCCCCRLPLLVLLAPTTPFIGLLCRFLFLPIATFPLNEQPIDQISLPRLKNLIACTHTLLLLPTTRFIVCPSSFSLSFSVLSLPFQTIRIDTDTPSLRLHPSTPTAIRPARSPRCPR